MTKQTPTEASSIDGAASALNDGLCIAARLRRCLRFDTPTPEESELEASARDAANELELLAAHCKRVEDWKQEGEALFERQGVSVMFSLGAWWADRPWRNRDA